MDDISFIQLLWAKRRQLRVRNIRRVILEPQLFFIVCALIFGITMLVFRPAYDVPDFSTHLVRGYSLAEGSFIPKELNKNTMYQGKTYLPGVRFVGGPVPLSVARFMHVSTPFYNDNFEKIAAKDQFKLYFEKQNNKLVDVPNNTAAVYNPIGYFPEATGFLLARITHLSAYAAVFLVSVINLTIWIYMIHKAIKVAVVGKWVIVVLNLLPMSIFLVPSVSTEGLLFGTIFLLFAYLTKYLKTKDELTVRALMPYISLSLTLSVLKPTYFMLLFLVILLHKKFATSRQRNFVYLWSLVIPMALVIAWELIVQKLNIVLSAGVNNHTQISFMVHEPLHVAWAYLNTLFFNFDNILWSFFGVLGRLALPIPLICVMLLSIAIVIAAGIDSDRLTFGAWQWRILGLIVLANIGLIFTSLYVYWSGYKAHAVSGLQGRYFIPLAIFIMPFMNKLHWGGEGRKKAIYATEIIVVGCLILSYIMLSRTYYPEFNVLKLV